MRFVHGIFCALACMSCGPAAAGTTIIGGGSAQLYVGAGSSYSTVDTIRFAVPGGDVGSGAPVPGFENGVQGSTLIDAYARSPGRSAKTVVWTIDSSQPLQCVTPSTCGTTTIPMTRFRWTTSGGDEVPSGAFQGTVNQPLLTFQSSRYVYVYLRFVYANDEIVPAGRYMGRVVYTLSMP